MAVTFDAVGPGANANAATLSWNHVVDPSATAIIVPVVLGGYFSDMAAPTNWTRSVTCGGVAMTSLGYARGNNTPSYPFVELWGLIAPPVNTQGIVVNYSGGASTPYLAANSLSYKGVGSFGAPVLTYSSNLSLTTGAVTDTPGNMLVAAQQIWANTGTATLTAPSGTARWTYDGTINTYPSLLVQDVAATGSDTLTSTAAINAFWGSMAVELKVPSAPVIPSTPTPNSFFTFF